MFLLVLGKFWKLFRKLLLKCTLGSLTLASTLPKNVQDPGRVGGSRSTQCGQNNVDSQAQEEIHFIECQRRRAIEQSEVRKVLGKQIELLLAVVADPVVNGCLGRAPLFLRPSALGRTPSEQEPQWPAEVVNTYIHVPVVTDNSRWRTLYKSDGRRHWAEG